MQIERQEVDYGKKQNVNDVADIFQQNQHVK